MSLQSIPCKESIFKEQPPNLRQHNGVISDSQGVCEIDYAPYLDKWFIRRTPSRKEGIEPKLILVNVYAPQSKSTYEWCRPDLETIVREENLSMLDRLLREDVLNYATIKIPTYSI
jgi:hypothetical protein